MSASSLLSPGPAGCPPYGRGRPARRAGTRGARRRGGGPDLRRESAGGQLGAPLPRAWSTSPPRRPSRAGAHPSPLTLPRARARSLKQRSGRPATRPAAGQGPPPRVPTGPLGVRGRGRAASPRLSHLNWRTPGPRPGTGGPEAQRAGLGAAAWLPVRRWPRAEPRILRSHTRPRLAAAELSPAAARSAITPRGSRDAASAAKARRRLGLGRAPHWPAPRVTRPASPPPPARCRERCAACARRVPEPLPLRARGPGTQPPPAPHPKPSRPRGSASAGRVLGEKVRQAPRPEKSLESASQCGARGGAGRPGWACPPTPLHLQSCSGPASPRWAPEKVGDLPWGTFVGEIRYGLSAGQSQLLPSGECALAALPRGLSRRFQEVC